MGKGDGKSKKGKIFRGSFGNSRKRKTDTVGAEVADKPKAAAKPKAEVKPKAAPAAKAKPVAETAEAKPKKAPSKKAGE